MVDMLTTAMGMDMLLLDTEMDRPLPKLPMVDMLLLTTTMDMPLSTTDGSTIGQDINLNTLDRSLLLDRGESSQKLRLN